MAASTGSSDDALYEEQLFLHGSDHPGMSLGSVLLTDSNYRMWRIAAVTALTSKDKLGIANGSCICPPVTSKYFRRWWKVDSMVLSWLKSSISKDLVNQFAYVSSASILWHELEDRYSVPNLSLLYQIKRDIAVMKQDGCGVTEFYGKLKDLTDQLEALRPGLDCECIARRYSAKSDDFKLGVSFT